MIARRSGDDAMVVLRFMMLTIAILISWMIALFVFAQLFESGTARVAWFGIVGVVAIGWVSLQLVRRRVLRDSADRRAGSDASPNGSRNGEEVDPERR